MSKKYIPYIVFSLRIEVVQLNDPPPVSEAGQHHDTGWVAAAAAAAAAAVLTGTVLSVPFAV